MSNDATFLDPEQLLGAASSRTGLDDFGADDFRTPFELLCESLAKDANLHQSGTAMQRDRLINLLCNRLRISDCISRHPEILAENINKPIFIAALPRTGTTMLHRFIAADPNMYAVLWYECRNPAPLGQTDDGRDIRIDMAWEEIRVMLENMPGLDAIHPMDAEGPDEEIMLLEHSFCSGMPLSMANVTRYNEWEQSADHYSAYTYLKQILQLLQWHKKRCGMHCQRWILKAPEHLGHTDILLRLFPDATILQGHRDPLQTLPSIASLIYSGWAAYTDNPDKHLLGRLWAERLHQFLGHCMDNRKNLPPNCMLDLWYRDLIEDPFSQAQKIYEHTGMQLTEEALQSMAQWREVNGREKRAAHHYTLEEFGFSEEQICESFADYRERYILDR